jgi:hypothetical protein
MSTLVASAFVSSNDPRWPEGVPELAIERHQEWCKSQGADYMLITDEDMEPFRALSAWPNSWAFGTLAKFVAIKRFLHKYLVSGYERFIWLDLDCIPMEHASLEGLLKFGDNAITVGQNSHTDSYMRKHYDLFQICKYAFHEVEPYHPVSSHIFSLSGPMANELMQWVEHGRKFGSSQWFAEHNNDVMASAVTAAEMWYGKREDIETGTIGNDEAYIEGWIQGRLTSFGWYDGNVVANYEDRHCEMFTHYYGFYKRYIPEALA